MLIKKRTGIDIPSSEITPKSLYLSRRAFIGGAAAVAGAAALTACAPKTDLGVISDDGMSIPVRFLMSIVHSVVNTLRVSRRRRAALVFCYRMYAAAPTSHCITSFH